MCSLRPHTALLHRAIAADLDRRSSGGRRLRPFTAAVSASMSPLLTPSDPSRVLIDRRSCRQDHAATLNATAPYELAPDASPPLRSPSSRRPRDHASPDHRADGYLLDADPDAVDAVRFTSLLNRSRQATAVQDCTSARVFVTEELALWRGAAYAEFAGQRVRDGRGAAGGVRRQGLEPRTRGSRGQSLHDDLRLQEPVEDAR